MTASDWTSLALEEQRSFLKEMKPSLLSAQFNRPESFFKKALQFLESAPKQVQKPTAKQHDPPKDLVVSARRDLSFFEANFELFDNAIDAWRKGGAKKDLHINVEYDQEQLTGKYEDDAGGMDENDVYKVFIPGETTNRDFSETVIGSFGMGAKKGIFRLTDGAKIISCKSPKFAATSEVPEKWEEIPQWQTMDGRAAATKQGQTEIYFFRLFNPPTDDEISELIERTSLVYSPLLSGIITKRKVHIRINRVEVKPRPRVNWSAPEGAAPRKYTFSHTFRNFLRTGKDITLNFEFICGLTRTMPGNAEDRERGWGIDVYGNGRMIEPLLKHPFGWGTTGMAMNNQANNFVRGELFINGHSFAIPWDTHKREYLADHSVSEWLRSKLRPIIKAYITIAGRFAGNTELRKTVLATSSVKKAFEEIELEAGSPPSEDELPYWAFQDEEDEEEDNEEEEDEDEDEEEEDEDGEDEDEDDGPEARAITVTLLSAEYDELLQRFGSSSADALATAIHDCLVSGVAFPLSAAQAKAALGKFKIASLGELSDKIKSELLKSIR